MTKSDIMRNMEAVLGKCFVTLSDIAKYMGVGRDTVRKLMKGVSYYPSGRSKLYHISDVAERIMKMSQKMS